jgi:hypothetical protein
MAPNHNVEAAMYDQVDFLDASGNLNHEAVRAHFLRVGKLSGLVKGEVVYIDFYGRWEKVKLVRRIPGDCWIARLLFHHPFCTKTTVTVGNFGGKCGEW